MSLVPYAGMLAPRAASGFIRYRKRARTVSPYIGMAARAARPTARVAARLIQRAWRRRKTKTSKRRRRMVPQAKATGQSRQDAKQPNANNVNCRTLQGKFLPNAPPQLLGDDFNVREKEHVYYSGYKICRIFENRGVNPNLHIFTVNYVIVQLRRGVIGDRDGGVPNVSEIIGDMKENFFRSSLNSSKRTEDFVDAPVAGASGNWDMTYDCNAMNPNKSYSIILRKKFTLYPRCAVNQTVQDRLNQNFKRIEFYMPVKKRMTFQNRSIQLPNTPFFELWWTNTRGPEEWSGLGDAVGNNTEVKTYSHHMVYFRNTK